MKRTGSRRCMILNRPALVVHANRLKKEPNSVTALVQYAKEANEDFWLVNGYDTPLDKRKTVYFLPATNDTKIVKDHFFGPSNLISGYDFHKTNFLTNTQVNTILNRELFTAYKQTSFNRKYLLQANDVRKYTGNLVSVAKKNK